MGDDERRNDLALSAGRGKGYGVREEEAGPVLVFGMSASVIYGLILCLLKSF